MFSTVIGFAGMGPPRSYPEAFRELHWSVCFTRGTLATPIPNMRTLLPACEHSWFLTLAVGVTKCTTPSFLRGRPGCKLQGLKTRTCKRQRDVALRSRGSHKSGCRANTLSLYTSLNLNPSFIVSIPSEHLCVTSHRFPSKALSNNHKCKASKHLVVLEPQDPVILLPYSCGRKGILKS